MIKYLTLLICIVLVSQTVNSTKKKKTCSPSCQLAKKYNCYRAVTCPIQQYLLNSDYFTLFVKDDIKKTIYRLSDYEDELIEVKETKVGPLGTFISSLIHYKENSTEIEQIEQSRVTEITNGLERRIREENYSANRERHESFESFEGSDYSISLRSSPVNILSGKLSSDIGICATYFEDNFNDEMRDVALYPTQCGTQCLVNYQVVYGVWNKIVKFLTKMILQHFGTIKSCFRRKSLLSTWFRDACQPYDFGMRRLLRNYLQFIFLDKLCDPEWFDF
jgi:hypothetical protein